MKTLIILSMMAVFAFGAASVGKVTALKGTAKIIQNVNERSAKLGSDVFIHDQIHTGDNTKMQLIFTDETIVTIGQKSQFSIDDYIAEGADSTAKMSLFKGAMRTITGKIGKANPQKFQVSTKTATIGIRGTNFVVFVTPEGETIVVCTYGAIVAVVDGKSVEVPSGFMLRILPDGTMGAPVAFNATELKQMMDEAFGSGGVSQEKAKEIEVITTSEEDQNSPIVLDETLMLDPLSTEILPSVENTANDTLSDLTSSAITDTTSALTSGGSAAPILPYAGSAGGISLVTLSTTPHPSLPYAEDMSYLIPFGFHYGIDASTETFTAGSYLGLKEGKVYFDLQPISYVNAFEFSGKFQPFSFTTIEDGVTYIDEYDATNYAYNNITTLGDLDAGDEMSWGEWSLPVHTTSSDGEDTYSTWGGYWVAGAPTSVDVINNYRNQGINNITYSGTVKGKLVVNDPVQPSASLTEFTGSVESLIDFGYGTGTTTIDYTTSDYVTYQIVSAGNISGNQLVYSTPVVTASDNPTSTLPIVSNATFYGVNGDGLAGTFSLQTADSGSGVVRTMTGAYQAITYDLP
jgi:hypothetical protein